MSIFTKIFGDTNQKEIDKLEPHLEKINSLEETLAKLTDHELKAKTQEFRQHIQKRLGEFSDYQPPTIGNELEEETKKRNREIEDEILEDILPEAFALVREAGKRALGANKGRHFDVQLLGGMVLHQGKIAEMKTGEGKTLVATLPLYLNALIGRGAHLITVNDYLARRDCGWNGSIYWIIGMSCSAIIHEQSFVYDPGYEDKEQTDERLRHLRPVTRQEAYLADITYGTNNEFGFDYLRENMAQDQTQIVQRPLNYGIVDEVDSILIDEARTPLIISSPAEESASSYAQFAQLVPRLKAEDDYQIDEKIRAVTLTDGGIKKMEQMLGIDNIYDARGISLVHHLEEALKAHALFKKNKDYVVKDGEVIIVDEFTGRLMNGRRYSEGLHQAIEAK
jgi:preprotein translocase subunit SecA